MIIIKSNQNIKEGVDLNYKIHYCCLSHAGKRRSINQDNFICNGKYMKGNNDSFVFPIIGCLTPNSSALLGVFDGMGGEEHGEIASLIASQCASKVSVGDNPTESLLQFCHDSNREICKYIDENDLFSMGTTAALLAFADKEIALCNIGDSKIFRFADRKLEQISVDHYSVAVYGHKPPLSQNLGIPETEMIIDPYVATGPYNDGDLYLICSDGLTDMVTANNISEILLKTEFSNAVNILLKNALENGGKDNITIILCRVEREKRKLFQRIVR